MDDETRRMRDTRTTYDIKDDKDDNNKKDNG